MPPCTRGTAGSRDCRILPRHPHPHASPFLSPPLMLEEARAPFPNRHSSLADFPGARMGGKVGVRGFADRFT